MKEESERSADLFKIIRNRRSIRNFTDKPVPDSVLEEVLKSGFRAPFSAQVCSIVYSRDPEKIGKLRSMGVYPSTKLLLIFLIDTQKLEKIISQRGAEYKYDDGLLLWFGTQDVGLVVGNIILAIEAFGLGSVLLGGAPLMADLISEVFNVPKRVFPVIALSVGYPDPEVEADIRPRFPWHCSAFEESYRDLTENDIRDCMKAMDDGYMAQGYYIKSRLKIPLKEGEDDIDYDRYTWSEHLRRKFAQGPIMRESLLSIIKRHGFNVDE
jgi:nitroreductase